HRTSPDEKCPARPNATSACAVAPRPGSLCGWRRRVGGVTGPTTVHCSRSLVRSLHVTSSRLRDGWTHRAISRAVRFVSGRVAKMPRRTFLVRSATTCTAVTRRCISLPPRIDENSPSRSSHEEPTFALGIEGERNRSTTPPTAVPTRGPGIRGAQRDVIVYLIEVGADPNAVDNSGVAPLHRAVRTRCSAAVSGLMEGGADPLLMNKHGSTPLHLAVQNTGKSHSGSPAAKEEQGRIIAFLLESGASPTDTDAKGKTVAAAASSDWI